MIKAYIFENEATNTGFFCASEILTVKSISQAEAYFLFHYDPEFFVIRFEGHPDLAKVKRTVYTRLEGTKW